MKALLARVRVTTSTVGDTPGAASSAASTAADGTLLAVYSKLPKLLPDEPRHDTQPDGAAQELAFPDHVCDPAMATNC